MVIHMGFVLYVSVGSDLNVMCSTTYEFHHQDIHSSCPEKIVSHFFDELIGVSPCY